MITHRPAPMRHAFAFTSAPRSLHAIALIVALAIAPPLAPLGCGDTVIAPVVLADGGASDGGGGDVDCPAPSSACEGACVNLATSNSHCGSCGVACSGGSYCEAGSCVCSNGQTQCDGVCSALDADPQNCGACGHACEDGAVCIEGECKDDDCPPGEDRCDGECTNLSTDSEHCGDCNVECKNGSCEDGECK